MEAEESPDGRYVYYAKRDAAGVFRLLATRATSVVLELPMFRAWDLGETGGAFTVSPDERWALLTALQVVESDIMLVEGFR
jgi:hypothetical protein